MVSEQKSTKFASLILAFGVANGNDNLHAGTDISVRQISASTVKNRVRGFHICLVITISLMSNFGE